MAALGALLISSIRAGLRGELVFVVEIVFQE